MLVRRQVGEGGEVRRVHPQDEEEAEEEVEEVWGWVRELDELTREQRAGRALCNFR